MNLRTRLTFHHAETTVAHRPSSHDKRSLKILYWTRFNEHPEWFGSGALDACDHRCHTTKDRAEIEVADAVLVHMRDIYDVRNLPEPKSRREEQIWIMYMRESPEYNDMPYTGYWPYNGKFNASMTYKQESEIYVPYFRFEKVDRNRDAIGSTEVAIYAHGKTKLVAWFVSNCVTAGRRENYVRLLQEHIRVDIYGGCTRRHCNETRAALSCDGLLQRDYKFYLAFENSLCDEYYTEKVDRAFKNNAVPVVLGGANYARYLPPNSYIDVRNFSSPHKLAAYLRELDADDSRYNAYFRWKTLGYRTQRVHAGCAMCEYLHTHAGTHPKTLRRADLLWNRRKDCKRPNDFYKHITGGKDMSGGLKEWGHQRECWD